MASSKTKKNAKVKIAKADVKKMVSKNDEVDAPKAKDKSPAIGISQLLLSFSMLILGIITPPMTSKYFPELGKFLSGGKKITDHARETSEFSVEMDEEEVASIFVDCNEENLSQFYHEKPGHSRGAHILCFNDDTLKFFKNYHHESLPIPLTGWYDLKSETIEGTLGVDNYRETQSQPWAIFSTTGERLVGELDGNTDSLDLLKEHGMVILFEGGTWLWPGVRIGFKRQVNLVTGYAANPDTVLEIETLSMQPLVVSVKNFIAEFECDHIQNISESSMEYSAVTLMDKDKGRPASDFRTSQSAFLRAMDDITHALEARTASVTRIPKNHQEHTQVLRYGYTEKYSAHTDFFDPALYQQDPNTLRLIDNGRKNRLATVFWYLSDVEEGGHTVFPRFNAAPQPRSFNDCTKGLLVKPEKGKVIIFYSLLPDGRRDALSLHGACPVKEGIKWAANKWVWNAPMGYVN